MLRPNSRVMRANKMINRFMVESCLVYLCIYDIVNISGIDMSVNLNKRTVFFVDGKDKEGMNYFLIPFEEYSYLLSVLVGLHHRLITLCFQVIDMVEEFVFCLLWSLLEA